MSFLLAVLFNLISFFFSLGKLIISFSFFSCCFMCIAGLFNVIGFGIHCVCSYRETSLR